MLELAAEKAGWGKPLPEGRGRGIAVHESFGSFVAHVVEVLGLATQGRSWCIAWSAPSTAVPTVNPDTIKAQMEGGAVFGLTAALYGEITFENGRVQQTQLSRLSRCSA